MVPGGQIMGKQKGASASGAGLLLSFWIAAGLHPLPAYPADDPLFDLNLAEVLDLEITSVSKKPQTVSKAAAAIHVITADDIRRSGASSIPEALRMAPGIQVAQISSSTWAISARGLDGRFTNKLLVLMDGRSVYSPTFSGVYWDVQDTVIADIERIEVIRGPGAALWGANAVNGVINIITKAAAATQGGLVSLRSGSEEQGSAVLRVGGTFGDLGHWRVYGKAFDRDATVTTAGSQAGDGWRQQRVGFRTDLVPTGADAVTVQGDYYRGRAGELSNLNYLTAPYNSTLRTAQDMDGGNLLVRWQREVSSTDSFTVQGYIDHTQRDWPLHLQERRATYDLDFQYRSRHIQGHDLVAGAAYRRSSDTFKPAMQGMPPGALTYSTVTPLAADHRLFSAFIQDDMTLLPERLVLTLGGKLEHNDYTGTDFLPNVRLLLTPGESTSLWTSVAKAVRTPSRVDAGGSVNFVVLPPTIATGLRPVLFQGGGVGDSERVVAYEAGIKHRFSTTLNADLSLFYNDYNALRSATNLPLSCLAAGVPLAMPFPCLVTPGSYILQFSQAGNRAKGWSHGAELSVDWRPTKTLRFQGALTQYRMTIREPDDTFSTDRERSAPDMQGSLRMAWNPRSDLDVDLWLRRVGRLGDTGYGFSIPGYTELDARLAWRPARNTEVALVGRNLLHKSHAEFKSELQDIPLLQIQRALAVQLDWKF